MVFERSIVWVMLALAIPRILGQTVSDLEWEHFELVNELRAAGFSCGGTTYAPNSQPLVFECRLWKASQLHSIDMAENNYFSHTSQDGRSPWARASAVGASAGAENIAAGSSTAQAVLNQWKNSLGHCKNMGNPNMRFFAVGYAYDSGSTYRNYWTQMLGRSAPSGGVDTSCYPAATIMATTILASTTTIQEETTTLAATTTLASTTTAVQEETTRPATTNVASSTTTQEGKVTTLLATTKLASTTMIQEATTLPATATRQDTTEHLQTTTFVIDEVIPSTTALVGTIPIASGSTTKSLVMTATTENMSMTSTAGDLASTTSIGKVTTILSQSLVLASLHNFSDVKSLSSAFADALSTVIGVRSTDVLVSFASAKLKLVYSQLPPTLEISKVKSAIATANNLVEDVVVVTWITERRRQGLGRRLAQTASAEIRFTSDSASDDIIAKVKSAKATAQDTQALAAELEKLTGGAVSPPVLEEGAFVTVATRTEIISSPEEAGQSMVTPSVIERVGQIIGAEVVVDEVQVILPSAEAVSTTAVQNATSRQIDGQLETSGAQETACGSIAFLFFLIANIA